MTEEQIDFLASQLQKVIDHKYGEVIITVSNGHVNICFYKLGAKFPLPKRSGG